MSGETIKVAVQIPDIHLQVWKSLCTIDEHRNAFFMGQLTISLTGLMVPSALETWVTATMRVLSLRRFLRR